MSVAESLGAPVMALEGVSKRFGAVVALDNVSLALREGEFFALLGPSGCGKTTLLRVLAGFETPDSGRVLLDGRDITSLRPNRRPVNMMFQSYALFPHMSVRANVAYGLEMERLPRAEIARRVDEILAMTQLAEVAGRRPDQLSGGQRQRVALARALVKRPRVLLLDEPLAALDRKLRQQMQLELKRLQHEVGITFVVVTHDQEEALVMADRIALMEGGRVVQAGTPRELYERPVSRFAAGFLGISNFLEGERVAGGLRLADGTLVRLAGEAAPGGAGGGGRATLAIRPERLRLAPRSPDREREAASGDARDALAGEVAEIAYHGNDLAVHVTTAAGTIVVRLPAGEAEAGGWRTGDPVWCLWDPAHARLLED